MLYMYVQNRSNVMLNKLVLPMVMLCCGSIMAGGHEQMGKADKMTDKMVDEFLKKTIKEAHLPQQIGENVSWVTIRQVGRGLEYRYVINKTEEEVKEHTTIEKFQKEASENLKAMYCSVPMYEVLRDNDITIYADYYTKERDLLGKISASPKDCKEKGESAHMHGHKDHGHGH